MNYIPEKIQNYLKDNLSSDKYRHSLGTMRVARELAIRYGVNEEKAIIAAFLHDIGRRLGKNEMIKYVRDNNLIIPQKDKIIKFNPSLFHSFISADIAKKELGITDKEILKAITLHTLGGSNMSNLSKIIYLSDMLAPDRRFSAVTKLRWLSKRDLDKALLMAISLKITYVLAKKAWLHPQVLKMWNDLITL